MGFMATIKVNFNPDPVLQSTTQLVWLPKVKLNNMAQRGIQRKGGCPNKWVDKAAKPNGLYLLAL